MKATHELAKEKRSDLKHYEGIILQSGDESPKSVKDKREFVRILYDLTNKGWEPKSAFDWITRIEDARSQADKYLNEAESSEDFNNRVNELYKKGWLKSDIEKAHPAHRIPEMRVQPISQPYRNPSSAEPIHEFGVVNGKIGRIKNAGKI